MPLFVRLMLVTFALIAAFFLFIHVSKQTESCPAHKTGASSFLKSTAKAQLVAADQLQCERRYSDAAAVYRQLLAGNLRPIERTYALNQLTGCYLTMDQDSLAGLLLVETGAFLTEHPDLPAFLPADYHFNQGCWISRYDPQKWEEAIGHFQQAAGIYQNLYGVGNLSYAQTINQIGLLYYSYAGTLDSALKYIPRCYELFQMNPEWKPFQQENLYGMALICKSQRDHQLGEAHIRSAINLAMDAQPADQYFLAQCNNLLGFMLKKQNRWGEARRHFQNAVAIAAQLKSPRRQEYYLEEIINDINDGQSAGLSEAGFLKKVDTLIQMGPSPFASPDRLMGYYYFMNQPQKAVYYYQRFLGNYRHSRMADRLLLDEAYFSLGYSHLDLNKFDLAFQTFRDHLLLGSIWENKSLGPEELLNPEKVAHRPFHNRLYSFLAEVWLKKYRREKQMQDLVLANRFYNLADSLNILAIHNETAILSVQKELTDPFYQMGMEATWLLFEKTGNPALLNQACRFMERLKGYVLFRDMQPNNTPFSENLQKLQVEKYQLDWLQQEKLPLSREQEARYSSISEALKKAYEGRQRQRSPHDSIFSIPAIQRRLSKEQGLIEFSLDPNWLYSLYIDADTVIFQRQAASPIETQIRTLRNLLQITSISPQDWIAAAHPLYLELIEPFKKAGKRQQLILIPERSLYLVPFEALVENDQIVSSNYFKKAPYLLHSTMIRYTPSWKVYLETERKGKILPRNPSLLCYNPGEASLPQSNKMIKELPQIFRTASVTIAKGRNCNKNHFFRYAPEKNILHFSVHSASDTTNWLNNRLLLRLPSKAQPGDTLYGYELLSRTYQAKLVVLGACESGLGPAQTKEGSYSVARCFLQAGAPVVMAALWQVSEATTAELLKKLYMELNRRPGSNPVEALRKAKIAFLQEQGDFLSQPVYWTGLVALE